MVRRLAVIVSLHIAEASARDAVALLLAPPRRVNLPGLVYAETLTTAPLGEPLLPPRRLDRIGLLAAWEEETALDAFLAEDPIARRLAAGWHVRLQPLRISGAWAELAGLPAEPLAVQDDEPVGVLTLGRLRLRRTGAFRDSAGPAEAAALASPALLAGIGLARPPRLVATFTLWHSAAAMRTYAYESGAPHVAAMAAHRADPFHREAAFIRFRPYGSHGSWDGRDPLAEASAVMPGGGFANPS
ncbi:MAG: spheroidene monooxygenase [Solirubrobacterales bacterium]